MNLKETRLWCARGHGDQRYGRHPYKYHLNKVENVALRFGIRDRAFRQACWGHDLDEDTAVTLEDMRRVGFEEEAVTLCWAVTDEEGETREERKAKTYPKIRKTPRAVCLKLCDRIANVEESIKTGSPKFEMYKKEHAKFTRELFNAEDTEAAPLWEHLNSLFAN